jgi:hypothetical protein
MQHESSSSSKPPISRRTALRASVAAGAAGVGMTVGAADPGRAAPATMQAEHLEVLFTPVDPVTITLAGGGPPQRGDHFYVDAPIYAVGDVNGTQIGTYQCFGAWTAPADATDAPNHRLTTVQFQLEDGNIAGLINEVVPDPESVFGAIQGGTGRYAGALGTFQQLTEHAPEEGAAATPGAPGTPGPAQLVVRAVFDFTLPQGG